MKNTDNGAKNRMAPVFGNFTDSMPSCVACLVLATLLFTMAVGTITDVTTTPMDAPITAAAATEETALGPIAPTPAAEAMPPAGTVKTKASKTEFAVRPNAVPAEPIVEAAPDRATAVDPAVVDVDLAEVNNPKNKKNDYRDPSKRMAERPSALQYLFGKFPTPALPW